MKERSLKKILLTTTSILAVGTLLQTTEANAETIIGNDNNVGNFDTTTDTYRVVENAADTDIEPTAGNVDNPIFLLDNGGGNVANSVVLEDTDNTRKITLTVQGDGPVIDVTTAAATPTTTVFTSDADDAEYRSTKANIPILRVNGDIAAGRFVLRGGVYDTTGSNVFINTTGVTTPANAATVVLTATMPSGGQVLTGAGGINLVFDDVDNVINTAITFNGPHSYVADDVNLNITAALTDGTGTGTIDMQGAKTVTLNDSANTSVDVISTGNQGLVLVQGGTHTGTLGHATDRLAQVTLTATTANAAVGPILNTPVTANNATNEVTIDSVALLDGQAFTKNAADKVTITNDVTGNGDFNVTSGELELNGTNFTADELIINGTGAVVDFNGTNMAPGNASLDIIEGTLEFNDNARVNNNSTVNHNSSGGIVDIQDVGGGAVPDVFNLGETVTYNITGDGTNGVNPQIPGLDFEDGGNLNVNLAANNTTLNVGPVTTEGATADHDETITQGDVTVDSYDFSANANTGDVNIDVEENGRLTVTNNYTGSGGEDNLTADDNNTTDDENVAANIDLILSGATNTGGGEDKIEAKNGGDIQVDGALNMGADNDTILADGADSNVVTNGTVNMGANDDNITASNNGVVTLENTVDGGAGTDNIVANTNGRVIVKNAVTNFEAGLLGGGTLELDTVNANLNVPITGGNTVDNIEVKNGTRAGTANLGGLADTYTLTGGTDSGDVNGEAGNDVFTMNGASGANKTGTLDGGADNDVFNVTDMTVNAAINGGADNDTLNVLTSGDQTIFNGDIDMGGETGDLIDIDDQTTFNGAVTGTNVEVNTTETVTFNGNVAINEFKGDADANTVIFNSGAGDTYDIADTTLSMGLGADTVEWNTTVGETRNLNHNAFGDVDATANPSQDIARFAGIDGINDGNGGANGGVGGTWNIQADTVVQNFLFDDFEVGDQTTLNIGATGAPFGTIINPDTFVFTAGGGTVNIGPNASIINNGTEQSSPTAPVLISGVNAVDTNVFTQEINMDVAFGADVDQWDVTGVNGLIFGQSNVVAERTATVPTVNWVDSSVTLGKAANNPSDQAVVQGAAVGNNGTFTFSGTVAGENILRVGKTVAPNTVTDGASEIRNYTNVNISHVANNTQTIIFESNFDPQQDLNISGIISGENVSFAGTGGIKIQVDPGNGYYSSLGNPDNMGILVLETGGDQTITDITNADLTDQPFLNGWLFSETEVRRSVAETINGVNLQPDQAIVAEWKQKSTTTVMADGCQNFATEIDRAIAEGDVVPNPAGNEIEQDLSFLLQDLSDFEIAIVLGDMKPFLNHHLIIHDVWDVVMQKGAEGRLYLDVDDDMPAVMDGHLHRYGGVPEEEPEVAQPRPEYRDEVQEILDESDDNYSAIYVQPFYRMTEMDTEGFSFGYDNHMYGGAIGLEAVLRGAWRVGAKFFYAYSDADQEYTSHEVEMDTFGGMGQVTYDQEKYYVDLQAGFAYHDIDHYRRRPGADLGVDPSNDDTNDEIEAFSINGKLEAGYKINNDKFFLIPHAAVGVEYIDIEGYGEDAGLGTARLVVGSDEITTFYGAAGLKLGAILNVSQDVTFVPHVRANVVFYFENDAYAPNLTNTLANGNPGPLDGGTGNLFPIGVNGEEFHDTVLELAANGTFYVTDCVKILVEYEYETGLDSDKNDYYAHTLEGEAKIKF